MLKNPTPRQLAILSAAVVAAVASVFLIGAELAGIADLNMGFLVFSILGIALAAYGIIVFALRQYIYRRIKLIYKTIHKFKAPKSEKNSFIDLQKHIIDEVEQEVFNWAKDQRKEIEDLKKLEAYRRDFIGNISHELKTPLFNIQGYLDTLQEGGLEDPTINKMYLQRAATNVNRLSNIVEDLDMISQLEASELHLDITRFDIRSLAYEIFEDFEMKADVRDVKLSIKEGCDKPFYVLADRERIRQVLGNLISNSIKYGEEHGKTVLSFYKMDKNILIEVSDNGLGIEEKHLSRLFERFYRADKSRSREQGGTGLGLSIVKHLIEAHNQTINVRSSLGVGSTFGFTLTAA